MTPARRAIASSPRGSAAAAACLALAMSAHAAHAGAWVALGALGGTTFADARLADYQWDLRPRAAWGAQALAGAGRFAAGVRAWRSEARQVLELPAGTVAPAVRSTSVEAIARVRLAGLAGVNLWGQASAGRIGIDYRPDRVVVSGGPGGDVVADLAPVSDWTAGGGIAIDRTFGAHGRAGIALDRTAFALDTAHRSGGSVVNARESFGDWNARFELAWQLPLASKGTSR